MLKKNDPFTSEVIQSSLQNISEEMSVVMQRTALSSIIYEVLDFGVGILDERGSLACQGVGIPGFVGMLDGAAKEALKKFGLDDIHPGDIFITNDPYSGGVGHSNDVALVMPVFFEEEIVAWAANKAHWSDIGGSVPGGLDYSNTELFQEGLILPDLRLFDRGVINQALVDTITANTRLPQTTIGDMWAAVATIRSAHRSIDRLCEKYGKDALRQAIADYLDYGEAVARREMKDLPKGTFSAERYTDDGLKLQVKITITDDEFLVDMRSNPAQLEGAANTTYLGSMLGAKMVFKAITNPSVAVNEGSFRPLKYLCDEGSMFAAKRPAAVGMYFEPVQAVTDLIWKALAPHMPEKLTAGHYQSVCGLMMGGTHPVTKKYFAVMEPELGGWGARKGADGQNAQFCCGNGDTFNCPVEINESRNGVFVEQYGFHSHEGGEGEYNGGKGIYLDYRILSEDTFFSSVFWGDKIMPWGMKGGKEGSANMVQVFGKDGGCETFSKVAKEKIKKGDLLRIITGNGGGYGNPEDRPRAKVLEDLKNEFITPEQARKYYNVEI